MKDFLATIAICVFILTILDIGADTEGVWGLVIRAISTIPLWLIVSHFTKTVL